VSKTLIDMGCYEVSLGDTIGIGTPLKAKAMLGEVLKHIPAKKIGLHFHDTRGQALANLLACLEYGIASIDSAVAGLGGCPYAKGASGNVSTEDVVYMLNGIGIETGIDLEKLAAAGQYITQQIGIANNSHIGNVLVS
jgi:hydroxymethylglutaryl-CoA lyase